MAAAGVDSSVEIACDALAETVKARKASLSASSWAYINRAIVRLAWYESIGQTLAGSQYLALVAAAKPPLGITAANAAALALFDAMATDVHAATGAGEQAAVDAIVAAARATIVTALG